MPPSIDELAGRARAGDAACFAALVAELRGPLVGFLARRVGDAADAEDAAQETFLRAYKNLEHYDPSRRFATWLYAIGKHVASDQRLAERRRLARERRGAHEAEVAAGEGPPATEVAEDDGAELWRRARATLDDLPYRALWLRYARDMSVGEVAASLGKSVVATRVMLFRARRRLLDEEGLR